MTLGTANITKSAIGIFVVDFVRHGSFCQGEQFFGNINQALRFCRERGLRVIEVAGL
jgi:hypothetical protein